MSPVFPLPLSSLQPSRPDSPTLQVSTATSRQIDMTHRLAADALWHDRLEQLSRHLRADDGVTNRTWVTRMTVPVRSRNQQSEFARGDNAVSHMASAPLTTEMKRWVEKMHDPRAPLRDRCIGEMHFIANAAGETIITEALHEDRSHAQVAIAAAQRLEADFLPWPLDKDENAERFVMVERLSQKHDLPPDLAMVIHVRSQIAGDISLQKMRERLLDSEAQAHRLGIRSSSFRAMLADLAIATAEATCTAERGWTQLASVFANACEPHDNRAGDYANLYFRAPLLSLAELLTEEREQQDDFVEQINTIDAVGADRVYHALAIAWLGRLHAEARAHVVAYANEQGYFQKLDENAFFCLVREHANAMFGRASRTAAQAKMPLPGVLALLLQTELADRVRSNVYTASRMQLRDQDKTKAARILLQANGDRQDRLGILMSHWHMQRGWTSVSPARQVIAVDQMPSEWTAKDVFRLVHLIGNGPVPFYPGAPCEAPIIVFEWAASSVAPDALAHVAVVLDALFLYVPAYSNKTKPPPFAGQLVRLFELGNVLKNVQAWADFARVVTAMLTQAPLVTDANDIIDQLLGMPASVRERMAVEFLRLPAFPNITGAERRRWMRAWLQDKRDAQPTLLGCLVTAGMPQGRHHAHRWRFLCQQFPFSEPAAVTLDAMTQVLGHELMQRKHASSCAERMGEDRVLPMALGQMALMTSLEQKRPPRSGHPSQWAQVTAGELLCMVACAVGRGSWRAAAFHPNFLALLLGAQPGDGEKANEATLAWRSYALLWAYREAKGEAMETLLAASARADGRLARATSSQSGSAPHVNVK